MSATPNIATQLAAARAKGRAEGVEESAQHFERIGSIWQQAEEPERARKLRAYAQDLRVFVGRRE